MKSLALSIEISMVILHRDEAKDGEESFFKMEAAGGHHREGVVSKDVKMETLLEPQSFSDMSRMRRPSSFKLFAVDGPNTQVVSKAKGLSMVCGSTMEF